MKPKKKRVIKRNLITPFSILSSMILWHWSSQLKQNKESTWLSDQTSKFQRMNVNSVKHLYKKQRSILITFLQKKRHKEKQWAYYCYKICIPSVCWSSSRISDRTILRYDSRHAFFCSYISVWLVLYAEMSSCRFARTGC